MQEKKALSSRPSGEEQGPVKDVGDKRSNCRGGLGAPTRRPGEQWEGLGFGGAHTAEPHPGLGPARGFCWLWGTDGGQGPAQCPHPEPGRLPWCARRPPVSRQAPVPGLGSSVCGLTAPLVPAWDSRRATVPLLRVISDPCPWARLTVCPSIPLPRNQAPHPLLGADRGGGCSCTSNSGCGGLGQGVERAVEFCYGGVGVQGWQRGLEVT